MTTRKKKILLSASTFPRWQGDTEPEFILQLAQALSEFYDISVLVPHCAGAAQRETMESVQVYRYRYAPVRLESLAYGGGIMANLKSAPWRWLLVPGLLLSQLLNAHRICRQQDIALVHAHWIIPQGLVMTLARWLGWRQTPVLLTSHGADLFSLRSPAMAWLKRRVLASCDRLNVVSHAMLPACEELGLDASQIVVRSMGVDLKNRFTCTNSWESRQGLVFVGRLVEKKGVETLIRAFAVVANQNPDLRLNLIGDGPLRADLESLAVELQCRSQINFAGAIPNREIPELLNAARIALVPSVIAADGDQEGLGLVAVEAMGCGCAVISSDLQALADVIDDGVTGLVTPAGDSTSLAVAIQSLLERDDFSQTLARQGRESALRKFDWQPVAADYQSMYEQLLEQTESN